MENKKVKIGITGQPGFVGTHLYNTLGLTPTVFQRIPFEDMYFSDSKKLEDFVASCDVIVHLAAMNRHNDPEVIYNTNIKLVKQLIDACETIGSKPYILFSSSTQEERDNLYGKSKKEGRALLEDWAARNQARFTGLVIPNVFGPYGHPYYNSVVATFCHQLTHNETPRIEIDGEMKLIYVGELVGTIIDLVMKEINSGSHDFKTGDSKTAPAKSCFDTVFVPYTTTIKVSKLLEKLSLMKENYFLKGEIPCLDDPFDRNLFNTLIGYIDHRNFFPFLLKKNTDSRGVFVETLKLNSGGQVSFSTTVPGITRGNHFHLRKAERFVVIKGKALIELRKIGTDKVLSFELNGDAPSFVDMPVWYSHNIKNIGTEELITLFWISEHFNSNDPDTFYEVV
ncbi:MAG: NAD dependent epimerase/dehydratase family protein [Bacteroidetes bacterium ADurb.Bin408]|nr:MAG: NAD dependent epimerase/dehydratase family protein [Bacteroidetes bacterium ADurb.Bin408]